MTGPEGVVVFPTSWTADPAFLSTVAAGLVANPLIRPATVAQYFDDVRPAETKGGEALERTLAPTSPADLRTFGRQLASARRSTTNFSSMVSATDPMPTQLDRLLQVASSGDLDANGRQAYLTAVEASSTSCGARSIPSPAAPSPWPAARPSCR